MHGFVVTDASLAPEPRTGVAERPHWEERDE